MSLQLSVLFYAMCRDPVSWNTASVSKYVLVCFSAFWLSLCFLFSLLYSLCIYVSDWCISIGLISLSILILFLQIMLQIDTYTIFLVTLSVFDLPLNEVTNKAMAEQLHISQKDSSGVVSKSVQWMIHSQKQPHVLFLNESAFITDWFSE